MAKICSPTKKKTSKKSKPKPAAKAANETHDGVSLQLHQKKKKTLFELKQVLETSCIQQEKCERAADNNNNNNSARPNTKKKRSRKAGKGDGNFNATPTPALASNVIVEEADVATPVTATGTTATPVLQSESSECAASAIDIESTDPTTSSELSSNKSAEHQVEQHLQKHKFACPTTWDALLPPPIFSMPFNGRQTLAAAASGATPVNIDNWIDDFRQASNQLHDEMLLSSQRADVRQLIRTASSLDKQDDDDDEQRVAAKLASLRETHQQQTKWLLDLRRQLQQEEEEEVRAFRERRKRELETRRAEYERERRERREHSRLAPIIVMRRRKHWADAGWCDSKTAFEFVLIFFLEFLPLLLFDSNKQNKQRKRYTFLNIFISFFNSEN